MVEDVPPENRYRLNILDSVAELGDIAHQRATWLDPEMQNPHFGYVEFVECFYDACAGDWRIEDRDGPDAPFLWFVKAGVISEQERDVLWDIHLALRSDNQPDAYDHAAILETESWHKVVRAASNAVAMFRATLDEPNELEALHNKLPSSAAKRWP